jgi:CheY-like chemotaxis protein
MPEASIRILWADDEIETLKPHVKFLEAKGMAVTGVTNGEDALDLARAQDFDVVFLDENMPGLSGLETLARLKALRPHVPVVMITKSEEENVMEDAIGSKISDYLIKPVNPNQVLLSVKKLVQGRELVSAKTTEGYQRDFREIAMAFFDRLDTTGWADIYRKLMHWDTELRTSGSDSGMRDVLASQWQEGNTNFGKFVMEHYLDWVNTDYSPSQEARRPLLSPELLRHRVRPLFDSPQESLFVIVLDCLRYDHWRAFTQVLAPYFAVEREEAYFSILPTATQYARNAIFSGLFPLDIHERYPRLWVFDDEEGGKNANEEALLREFLTRNRLDVKWSYTKVITNEHGKQLEDNALNLCQNDVNFVVVNFIDLVAHARAEMSLIKELAPDEAAFRSLSESWLQHSSFLAALKKLRDRNVRILITTDHGVIRVRRPAKIVGDRETSVNLRYKHGRNLNYDEKARYIFSVKKPKEARLPTATVSGSYAFCAEDYYFVYPNNYNHFVRHYEDTFQHGGISMEECIIPLAVLVPR